MSKPNPTQLKSYLESFLKIRLDSLGSSLGSYSVRFGCLLRELLSSAMGSAAVIRSDME